MPKLYVGKINPEYLISDEMVKKHEIKPGQLTPFTRVMIISDEIQEDDVDIKKASKVKADDVDIRKVVKKDDVDIKKVSQEEDVDIKKIIR